MNPQEIVEEYLNKPWKTEVLREEDEGKPLYVASNPELGICIGQGGTLTEALLDLKEARRQHLSVMVKMGRSIPAPAFDMPEIDVTHLVIPAQIPREDDVRTSGLTSPPSQVQLASVSQIYS